MNNINKPTVHTVDNVTLTELVNYAALATSDENEAAKNSYAGYDSPAAKILYSKEQAAINILTDFFFQGNRWEAMDYIEKHGDPEQVPERIQANRSIFKETQNYTNNSD